MYDFVIGYFERFIYTKDYVSYLTAFSSFYFFYKAKVLDCRFFR